MIYLFLKRTIIKTEKEKQQVEPEVQYLKEEDFKRREWAVYIN